MTPQFPMTSPNAAEHAVRGLCALLCALLPGLSGLPAAAQQAESFGSVIRIDPDAFGAESGRITFSELALGSINPIFSPSAYGGPPDGVMVGFSGFFEGQSIGNAASCPRGAVRTGCVVGVPAAPLRLGQFAPAVFIANDSANPTTPSLSGTPRFNGPVSFVFDRDVAGVGLAGGFFDSVKGTAIQAFDRQGNLLGGVRNAERGMEYMALVTEDGSERIAGVQFSIVGREGAGFAVDNITFALSGQLLRDNIQGIRPLSDQPAHVGAQRSGMQLMRPLQPAP